MINLRGFSSRPILAFIALVTVAGAGAYYYVNLSETEVKPAKAVQSPAKTQLTKPQPVQNQPVSSVEPVATVVPPPAQAPAQIASVETKDHAQGNNPESLKSEPVVKKAKTRKPKPKATPSKSFKVKRPIVQELPQQKPSSVPAVLPNLAVVAAEQTIINPKYNDILTPALRGDREGVKQLLELGRWVDKPGSSGLTPLMAAIMNRDAQMVQLLIEHGAEPTVQTLDLAKKNKDSAILSLLERH